MSALRHKRSFERPNPKLAIAGRSGLGVRFLAYKADDFNSIAHCFECNEDKVVLLKKLRKIAKAISRVNEMARS